ncbi:hypothetical protein EGW08_004230 [Elysia chlorotica]|uniref:Uncharacterized protein n=1 Tax=Elysia chlorotica TaxID=188477 RepID=A0A3S1BGQ2_ELYCH|nr:hypothetical protein EGW08_004230 [Elysia chlorotica]
MQETYNPGIDVKLRNYLAGWWGRWYSPDQPNKFIVRDRGHQRARCEAGIDIIITAATAALIGRTSDNTWELRPDLTRVKPVAAIPDTRPVYSLHSLAIVLIRRGVRLQCWRHPLSIILTAWRAKSEPAVSSGGTRAWLLPWVPAIPGALTAVGARGEGNTWRRNLEYNCSVPYPWGGKLREPVLGHDTRDVKEPTTLPICLALEMPRVPSLGPRMFSQYRLDSNR